MMRERPNKPVRMRSRAIRHARQAFTIIELLMVVGIIIVILGIIIVAVNAAMRTAQSTNTQALMTSISNGLVQFRTDIGYLPPVLDGERSYWEPPMPPGQGDDLEAYVNEVQDWSSFTSLAEYLIGYGDATETGYGAVPGSAADFPENENDGPLGIRHPGPDGYWGVAGNQLHACVPGGLAPRSFAARKAFLGQHDPCRPHSRRFRQGRSYGPYIELRDERLLGAVVGGDEANPIIAFPGEANYDPDAPRVIVDYWGEPIRYFRKPYVPGMPNQEYRRGMYNRDGNELLRSPTLSDIFVLRPWRLRPGEEVDGLPDGLPFNPDVGDTTTTRGLQAAPFALLSTGPDRRLDRSTRADEQEFNRDNIVELGR